MSQTNRITFLSICDELDVKGTLSGKEMIHENHRPIDILGFYLQREQFVFYNASSDSDVKDPSGNRTNPYEACQILLSLPYMHNIETIWTEIDREDSTNESIRQTIRNVFSANFIHIAGSQSCSDLS